MSPTASVLCGLGTGHTHRLSLRATSPSSGRGMSLLLDPMSHHLEPPKGERHTRPFSVCTTQVLLQPSQPGGDRRGLWLGAPGREGPASPGTGFSPAAEGDGSPGHRLCPSPQSPALHPGAALLALPAWVPLPRAPWKGGHHRMARSSLAIPPQSCPGLARDGGGLLIHPLCARRPALLSREHFCVPRPPPLWQLTSPGEGLGSHGSLLYQGS